VTRIETLTSELADGLAVFTTLRSASVVVAAAETTTAAATAATTSEAVANVAGVNTVVGFGALAAVAVVVL